MTIKLYRQLGVNSEESSHVGDGTANQIFVRNVEEVCMCNLGKSQLKENVKAVYKYL